MDELSSCKEYLDVTSDHDVPIEIKNESNQRHNQKSIPSNHKGLSRMDDGSDNNIFKFSKDQKTEMKLRSKTKYTKTEKFKRIEKKFACEVCGKMMRPCDLTEHLNFHNGNFCIFNEIYLKMITLLI